MLFSPRDRQDGDRTACGRRSAIGTKFNTLDPVIIAMCTGLKKYS